ncbi:hypothetical protein KFL_003200150 [Klebsormidium nitens]|uniref:FAS1 domain-containing protein n=1 Tax=Klebsormidium nitens TaxID=105231 RepID=A0A1Y1I8R0_KLENI|nr:hypothetical protein KFL_003200150 [Klebsormidium nitens]|eukprot:GAQ86923.1 hypothetical protein KFL_003200150 [Klebsormidium nitens]
MASAKLLFVLSAALLLSSACAQLNTTANSTLLNGTAPLNATTPVNTTAPVITPVPVNATVPPAANSTNASLPSNATLAVYRAVRSQALALIGAFSAGNFSGVASYLSPDVQLVLPNTTAPVTLNNVTALLPFISLLTPPAGSNVTVNNVSDLYFYTVDSTNVLTVFEATLGQLGNVYITGFWQLLNSTTSPNGTWVVALASMTPAPSGPFISQTLPVFAATPNVTISSNVTTAPQNTSIPTNLTIEATVVSVSNGLQAAFSNASLSPVNVTSQYFAPFFQVVLPTLPSPTPLNLTDPIILTFFNLLQGRNATGNAAPQTVVSYKQLNNQSAILTTLVPALPSIGDVYVIQLWQLLNASTGSNTTTGVNTTIPTNTTTAPLAQTWQLTFASVNLAPNSAAPGAVVAGAPVSAPGSAPAPAPTQGASTEAPAATTANAPAATTSTAAGGPAFAPTGV